MYRNAFGNKVRGCIQDGCHRLKLSCRKCVKDQLLSAIFLVPDICQFCRAYYCLAKLFESTEKLFCLLHFGISEILKGQTGILMNCCKNLAVSFLMVYTLCSFAQYSLVFQVQGLVIRIIQAWHIGRRYMMWSWGYDCTICPQTIANMY